MAATSQKRKAEGTDWEQHRETIARLYMEEDRSLADVQRIMAAAPYNFQKT